MNKIIHLPSSIFTSTIFMLFRVVLHSAVVNGDSNLDDEELTSSF